MSPTPHRRDISVPKEPDTGINLTALEKLTFPDSSRQGLTPSSEDSFTETLSLLDQVPIRAQVWEAHTNLKGGIETLSSQTCARALERFTALPAATQGSLVIELLKRTRSNALSAPLSHYVDDTISEHLPESDEAKVFFRLGASLLLEGVPPREEFRSSLFQREMTLLDTASEGTLSPMIGLAIVTGATFWQVFSPTIGTISMISFLAASGFDVRDSRIAQEVVRGYTLECLDTYETIQSGQICDIGETLNNTFRNPDKPDNLSKEWRTEGFLLARALRLFGHSPDDVRALFAADARVNLPHNDLVTKVRSDFSQIDAHTPPSLMIAFDAEERAKPFDKMREVIALLNEVYFINQLCERQRIRCQFAATVLAAET